MEEAEKAGLVNNTRRKKARPAVSPVAKLKEGIFRVILYSCWRSDCGPNSFHKAYPLLGWLNKIRFAHLTSGFELLLYNNRAYFEKMFM